MDYAILLLPVILPAAFWAGYHWYVDRHLPEPASHLLVAFLLGVGSFFLGLLMYRALDLAAVPDPRPACPVPATVARSGYSPRFPPR